MYIYLTYRPYVLSTAEGAKKVEIGHSFCSLQWLEPPYVTFTILKAQSENGLLQLLLFPLRKWIQNCGANYLPSLVSRINCCMNSLSYMSLSRAAISQIETLSPQFTVTAESKASWWLRDWCSLKYMAPSHKNISSSVQYWIFHGVLVSSHCDTEAETNPFPLALLSLCKSLKFFLFIFKHIKTTKEMYYCLWWGWSH